MADREYRVRISAETKQATDKIDAVQNSLNKLTDKEHAVRVNVDANALRQSTRDTEHIANNIRKTAESIKDGANTSIVSGSSLNNAASLAGTFYSLRKDVRGLESDLGRALGKTNVSEFMRTEKFLDRILDNSRSRSREIVETYKNIREVPGTADLLGPVENFARSKAWEEFGGAIADQTLTGVKQGLQAGVQETKRFFYGDLFDEIGQGTSRTIDTLARLGLAIQGVQLLLGPLAATWSAAFDSIIGQNVRLQQTILSTQTTLASTGRVINEATGAELTDPLAKIQALESGVRQAVDNIRVRSLDLAGVTSSQIIDIFGVVSTSISQVGGNLKDAEDLAISFTAALGTLGIPFYQARQEIGSILGGYITEDSLLAKRLQISNTDIAQARNSIDGVVGYLQKKLETAVAGQAISARSFAGVTSNIREVFEVMGQRLGEPLLEPLVAGLTVIYNVLKKIQGVVIGVGSFLSRTIVKTVGDIVNAISNSSLVQGIGKTLDQIAQPFEQLARSVELGFGGKGTDLIQRYVSGLESVPGALRGVITGLSQVASFLSLQVALIVEPITRLLDQTRDRLSLASGGGIVQSLARAINPGAIFEGAEVVTKGWDTVRSTIEYAAAALTKFAVAFAKLQITAFTAQLRAAADVFELFGSLLLGKLNLAISFFDWLGNIAGSDLAKFAVSLIAINKLLNNTEFFGMKGLLIWLTQTRQLFSQITGDIKLFVQGFRDAGNINNLLGNAQSAYAKVFAGQAQSKNTVIQTAAQVEQLTQRLTTLNALQAQMAAQGAGATAMAKYGKAIQDTTTQLEQLKKTQQSFTATQRAGAALRSLFGDGAEAAKAKEAARQASVLASGAASAQALSGAINALGQKLGLTREQMKGLGGAATVATKSLQTFLTTSLLINVGFTAVTLLLAAGIAAWQRYDEAQKKASMTAKNMAAIQKILASEYTGIIKAAEGGDVAAQKLLQSQRDLAQSQYSQETSDLEEAKKKYSEINDDLFKRKKLLDDLNKLGKDGGINTLSILINELDRNRVLGDRANILKQMEAIEKRRFQALQAINKLEQEQNLRDTYKILAEKRKDIEAKIKTAREDYTKELTDKEFQVRMELLGIEQQKRQEMAEQEKASLTERFRLLSNNATEQEQRTLQLVEDYENAILDAANNENRRRSEFVQKEAQLRKEIEDYAFKMRREKLQLEKQLGNYQKEIENYKNKQTDLRIQKELAAMRQRAVLSGTSYQPYSLETQQQFINATQKDGGRINSNFAYAALQVIPKDVLGLSGAEGGDVAIEKLLAYLKAREEGGRANDLKTLIRDFISTNALNVDQLADALLSDSKRALNNNQFYVRQNPADLRTPDLSIDWAGMQRRMAAAQQSILNATGELNRALDQKDGNAIDRAARRFADPSLYTEIKTDFTSELERINTELGNNIQGLQNFNTGVANLEDELDRIKQSATATLRTVLKNTWGKDWSRELDEQFKAQIDQILAGGYKTTPGSQKIFDQVATGYQAAVAQARGNFSDAEQVKLDTALSQLVNRTRTQTEEIKDQIEAIRLRNRLEAEGLSPARITAEENKLRLRQELERLERGYLTLLDAVIKKRDELQQKIGTATDAEKVDLEKQLAEALAKIAELQRRLGELPEIGEGGAKAQDALAEANTEDPVTSLIGRWQEELNNTKARVAELAQTVQTELGNAMSSAIIGVINGTTTVREAFGQMFANIGKAFIDMATQMISKMIVMFILKKLLGGLLGGGGEAPLGFGGDSDPLGAGGGFWNNAKGNIFSSRSTRNFAKGGAFTNAVVKQPTLFRFADGGTTKTGLMGEAGPEAIMPLRRGPSGRLGVDANGLREAMNSGGAGGPGGTVLNMNFETTKIGGVEYVSRDQLEAAMAETRRKASRDGAQRGMTMTLDRIKQSPQTRNRIGIR